MALQREILGPSLDSLEQEVTAILDRADNLCWALQRCAETLVNRLNGTASHIWLRRGDRLELQASAGCCTNLKSAHASIQMGQFKVGRIALTGQPEITSALHLEPPTEDMDWARSENLTSFAGYPLLADEGVEGVVTLFGRQPFPGASLDRLARISDELARAIQSDRMHSSDSENGTRRPGSSVETAILTLGRDATITLCDRGAERLLGYSRHEVLGRSIAMLIPHDRLAEFRKIMARVRHGELIARPVAKLLGKNNVRIDVGLNIAPLRDADGGPAGAVMVMTDRSATQHLDLQYQQAQKMEVFGKLAGGVAHDFNNLLTVILGYTEILTSCFEANDARLELLAEIRKAGERAEDLTRQILAFSRKQVIEPKVLDLNAVLSDTEKMLRRLIGDDIMLTTLMAPSPCLVKIDPGQLQQVILNLAVNARDAMPTGGTLSFQTADVIIDDTYCRCRSDVLPGSYVTLTVSDTGVGMNALTMSHLFESHFTTKAPGKGTGLGLMMVHRIVKHYGGHIEVSSNLGRGSTFKIFLPQASESTAMNASPSSLHTIPRGCETVLLVEDDDSVRSLTRHVLRASGYQVLEAADGDEALHLAAGYTEPIHMLISDVVMPRRGGRQLAEELLLARPDLKVLFFSGYTSDTIERSGLTDTIHTFLQKPFTSSTLARTVRNVLDARTR
jgi:two-component system, cell cycle sensor histidine kinase and response regulator CckA